MSAFPDRYSLCPWPWSAVQPSDLKPQGDPEVLTETRRDALLGLLVKDERGSAMGLLGLRCEPGSLNPLSAALSEDVPPAETDDAA